MPESLDSTHREHLQRAQQFVELMRAQSLDAAGGISADGATALTSAARALGLHGMTQPRAFGGSEAGALALTVVRETLAAANLPGARYAFGPGPGVLAGAEGVLRTHYLEPMLRGAKRAAFAFTEPRNAQQHTHARADGEGFVVNGEKAYVTGGAEADFLNVLVELDGGARALLVIDRDAAGVDLVEHFRSTEGGHHVRIQFDNVCVPATHLLGKPGEGIPRAMLQIGDTRLLLAAEATGLMLWIDAYVANHLLAPHSTGTPLGAREGVRLRYADMRIDIFTARSTLYRAARIADSGVNAMNEVVIAKVFCTEALGRVVDMAIQLVGGRALDAGHPLEQLYRRVRSLRIAEGASDLLRLNLAKGRLDLNKGNL